MKVVQEVTEWEVDTPNHIYVLGDDGKLIAYSADEGKSFFTFGKPLMFDKKHRKFKKLSESLYNG